MCDNLIGEQQETTSIVSSSQDIYGMQLLAEHGGHGAAVPDEYQPEMLGALH